MTRIYEPIYLEHQRLVEPLFLPLHLTENRFSAWREFRILVDFYREKRHLEGKRNGIFSPKFHLKTLVSADAFLAFCDRHADADVCLINPFPQWSYFAYNVWMQGESYHPGLVQCAQDLLDAAGLSLQISSVGRHGPALMAYSNFWVASPGFWDRYVGGVLDPIAKFLESDPTHPAALAVMADTYHTDQAPFLPFIAERLFSTFLSFNPDLKIAAYQFESVDAHCLNDVQRAMVACMQPTVDAADAAGRFDEGLVRHLQYICSREAELTKAHFLHHPHPHTGRTIQQA
ncbi:hypothetical protein [Hydrogenophaga sp. PAMC20947]|uniref:hypothetical protein n=1 Tax=Hydrogenophaga sp. PAMC20947 TaxID=2565558 RepID=UPI00109E26E2|nr:hypothetical protein [Hydrogenophaga sp. PAMC20947]QCB46350.1 hypothetical protein E5678_10140 [Hydrogenophaga sp. PAMC20947]